MAIGPRIEGKVTRITYDVNGSTYTQRGSSGIGGDMTAIQQPAAGAPALARSPAAGVSAVFDPAAMPGKEATTTDAPDRA